MDGRLLMMVCHYCKRPIKQLYPEARYELQWGHINRDDAEECPRRLKHAARPVAYPRAGRRRRRGMKGLQGNGGFHRKRATNECQCGSPHWSNRHAVIEFLRDVAITITGLDL